jgi:phytoene dehydrogenase-like protein
MIESTDLVIIGGGLGGLAAAALAAKAGLSVTVLEKASELGGRAGTTQKRGFSLNFGAHALYQGSHACSVLDELGVAYPGRKAPVQGAYALSGGALHTLPMGFISLVSTDLLGLTGKLEIGKLLGNLARIDSAAEDRVTVTAWLERTFKSPETRALLAALFRLVTYMGDTDQMSAGAALAQLQLVTKHSVLYLDDGWRTLVDGLRRAATAAGARILTGAKATSVDTAGHSVNSVTLADGTKLQARAVILAVSPAAASALVPSSAELAAYAEDLIPVPVACLDVALASLPDRRALFALGIDRPLYASVHSASARLAPAGGALVHLLNYLPSGDARADEAELAALLDRLQPGWREVLVEKRFLPSILATNALVTAAGGGLAGRPGHEVPGVAGLYLAGDWVGPTGMLADAALAGARVAAHLAAAHRKLASAA